MPGPERDVDLSKFFPLVRRIAHTLMARLPPSVHIDDLIQSGMLGLLDAAKKYHVGLGATFRTYAGSRIRGAMLDGLRRSDWLPRGLRKSLRKIEGAVAKLEQMHGRPPTEAEVARYIGVSLAQYQQIVHEARGHQLVYYEDFRHGETEDVLDQHFPDLSREPLTRLLAQADRERVVDEIAKLPPREQLVLDLYYEQDMTLAQVGAALGVSEGRACQILQAAHDRLRKRLQ